MSCQLVLQCPLTWLTRGWVRPLQAIPSPDISYCTTTRRAWCSQKMIASSSFLVACHIKRSLLRGSHAVIIEEVWFEPQLRASCPPTSIGVMIHTLTREGQHWTTLTLHNRLCRLCVELFLSCGRAEHSVEVIHTTLSWREKTTLLSTATGVHRTKFMQDLQDHRGVRCGWPNHGWETWPRLFLRSALR